MSCHARHSGAEALFLTPTIVRDVGDENCVSQPCKSDMLFCYEPRGICQHASEDASEVAWLYHDACIPRRWVSDNGDPTNQTGPWHTVDVALNKWGKVIEEHGFYMRCGRMPRSGEQQMVISHWDPSHRIVSAGLFPRIGTGSAVSFHLQSFFIQATAGAILAMTVGVILLRRTRIG